MGSSASQTALSRRSTGQAWVVISCLLFFVLAFAAVVVSLRSQPAQAQTLQSPSEPHKGGLGWTDGIGRMPALAEMGVSAVYHWEYTEAQIQATEEFGIEYLPQQFGCRPDYRPVDEAAVRQFALLHPGLRWLTFNEPDNSVQADCTPDQAAEQYHILYYALKDADPTAKVYCCGTTYWPRHRDWTAYWAAAYRARYGDWPPLDGFHVHSYGTCSSDLCDYGVRQQELGDFHQWQQGQQWAKDKPVVLSEWGVYEGAQTGDQQRIADEYLPQKWQWLEAQDWIESHFWFSTYTDEVDFDVSNVFAGPADNDLTVVGEAWRRMSWEQLGPTPTPTPTATPGPLYPGAARLVANVDAYINGAATNANNGWRSHLLANSHDTNSALIRFDLGDIPTTAVITEAHLDLHVDAYAGSGDLQVEAFRVFPLWDEMSTTWNMARTGIAWGVAGCNSTSTDRSSVPSGSVTVRSAHVGGDVSMDLTSLVQIWVAIPVYNQGLILRGQSTSDHRQVAFSSSEQGLLHGPRLRVSFVSDQPPTPTPTPTETPTWLPTASPTATATHTPTATATPTPSATPSPTHPPKPTFTSTATPMTTYLPLLPRLEV